MNGAPQKSAADRAAMVIKEVTGVKSLYGIDERTMQFLRDLVARGQHFLSPKQRAWLDDIERRVFGSAGDAGTPA